MHPPLHPLRGVTGYQTFTAPIDGTYKWRVNGAMGGTDSSCCSQSRNQFGYNAGNHRGANGGDGGSVVATHTVKAGTKFYIRVGQQGYDCRLGNSNPNANVQQKRNCIYNPSGHTYWDNGKQWWDPAARHNGFNACGGFNGGGPAICNHDPGGASGGGASDVRMCKQGGGCEGLPGLGKRFLVGAGGGQCPCIPRAPPCTPTWNSHHTTGRPPLPRRCTPRLPQPRRAAPRPLRAHAMMRFTDRRGTRARGGCPDVLCHAVSTAVLCVGCDGAAGGQCLQRKHTWGTARALSRAGAGGCGTCCTYRAH